MHIVYRQLPNRPAPAMHTYINSKARKQAKESAQILILLREFVLINTEESCNVAYVLYVIFLCIAAQAEMRLSAGNYNSKQVIMPRHHIIFACVMLPRFNQCLDFIARQAA